MEDFSCNGREKYWDQPNMPNSIFCEDFKNFLNIQGPQINGSASSDGSRTDGAGGTSVLWVGDQCPQWNGVTSGTARK